MLQGYVMGFVYLLVAAVAVIRLEDMHIRRPDAQAIGWWAIGAGSAFEFAEILMARFYAPMDWGQCFFSVGALLLVVMKAAPALRKLQAFDRRQKPRDAAFCKLTDSNLRVD